MSNDIINRCCICEADFRPDGLDKDGKCASCRVAFPTVKTKRDALTLNNPGINLGEKLTAEGVRQIIKEELNTFKAEQKVEQEKIDRMAKARAVKLDKKDDDNGDKK